MNRILLAGLVLFLFSFQAICQEPENQSPPRGKELPQRPVQVPAQDTSLRQSTADTTGFTEIPEYVSLWESDTLEQTIGEDTIAQFRTAPRVKGDTAHTDTDLTKSPSRALMLSLVLPGLGQAYNQKYFKIPIVWAAVAGAGYAINYNSKQYYAWAELYAADPDNTDDRYLEYWRRNMELSYIAMIAVYALQVLDSYVDAHLYNWDVNDNLSMGVSPSLQPLMAPGSLTGYSYGLTCSFNLRRK